MHRLTLIRRTSLAALAATVAVVSLADLAYAEPAAPPVPGKIAVPEGNKLYLVAHAVGVQIYSCNATSGGGFGWRFVAPRADLYADNGKLVATHFAGPRWQARDGSVVTGQRVDGVNVDPSAIDWLLLSASAASGPDGDRFAGTTFIQRIATTGGLIPGPASCNEETVGNTEEVAYTADYTFWKADE
jgi:Protein of unknown function (DUF3455)